jgi:peptidoglycan/LPS O-acetylase OafA/YrhL
VGRLPVVDGLRAIAILAVALFHSFPTVVTGGFIGVDIFFVISGFVIALRYLDPMVSGEVTFTSFFSRRIQRLVPAYIVVIVVVTIVSAWILSPKDLVNFSISLATQATYAQNIAFWYVGDYFDRAQLKPLLHTWSLGVEEQFYLLFPLAILLLRWRRAAAIGILVLAAIGSVALGWMVGPISPKTTFYWLPFRAWEFFAGIFAAMIFLRHRALFAKSAATALTIAGTGALLVAIVAFQERAAFPGAQSLLACGGTVAICLSQLSTASWSTTLFTNRVSQHFGRISYSWYLWHWPLISFYYVQFHRMPDVLVAALLTFAGYALGAASYRYVERWGLESSWLRRPRSAALLLLCFLGFSGIAGLSLMTSNGWVSRYPASDRALLVAQMDRPSYRCPLVRRLTAWRQEICQINSAQGEGGVLIMGDSHADRAKEEIAALGDSAGVPVYLVKQNCKLVDYGVDPKCPMRQWQQIRDDVAGQHITKLLLVSHWATASDDAPFEQAFERASRLGVQIYVLLPTPEGSEFDPGVHIGRTGWDQAGITLASFLAFRPAQRAALLKIAKDNPGITPLDPTPLLCANASCPFSRNGIPLYSDYNHLTIDGVRVLEPLWMRIFSDTKTPPGFGARRDPNAGPRQESAPAERRTGQMTSGSASGR